MNFHRACMLRDDEGAVAVIIAICMTVIIALAAVAVDAGPAYIERARLQTAADAAVLAGVSALPSSPSAATALAEQYLEKNAPEAADSVTISISSTFAANDTIHADTGVSTVEPIFGRILGYGSFAPSARATAIVASPDAYGSGVLPFGIMARTGDTSPTAPFGYTFNESVELKQSYGLQGNFHLVGLPVGSHGNNNDITAQIEGSAGEVAVSIGDLIKPAPGHNGKTITKSIKTRVGNDEHAFSDVARLNLDGSVDLIDPTCPRVIVCPLIVDPGPPVQYNWIDLNGASGQVEVIGFVYFFVEDWGTQGNKGNEGCTITGRFIRPLNPDEYITDWGPVDDYGAIVPRLIL